MSAPSIRGRAPPPVSAEPPRASDDRFCPECLRPFGIAIRTSTERQRIPWWAAILVAAGLYLIILHAFPAWSVAQSLGPIQGQLDDVANCPDGGRIGPECGETKRILNVEASASLLNAYAVASQSFRDNLARSEIGGMALLLGLTAIGRRLFVRRPSSTASTSIGFLSRPWLLVDGLSASAAQLFLVGLGALVLARLVSGQSPSFELLDASVNQIVDQIIGFVQLVGGGASPRPLS